MRTVSVACSQLLTGSRSSWRAISDASRRCTSGYQTTKVPVAKRLTPSRTAVSVRR
ncbi:Uncharacterised protein [Bordetella pertussis]|nr:Uncharacterised protein [Bordetella pertussis]